MRKLLVALGGLFLCLSAAAQNSSGTQTLTVANAGCVSGSCVLLKFDSNDVASATISLSGAFTATVQFEASSDGLALTDANKVWVAINGTPLNGTTGVSSATTANTWKFNVASNTDIRARCSAFTSAPTVVIKSSKAVANAGGGGGTSLPALSDNGTNVITTEPIVGPASNAACVLCVSGNITSGIAQDFTGSGPRLWGIAAGVRRGWELDSGAQTLVFSSGGMTCWNSSATDPGGTGCDTGLSRSASGVVAVGTGAALSSAGTLNAATHQYRGLAQTYFVSGDFTTSGSGTALELITGLSWTFPATTAMNVKVDCYLDYNQNVAAVAVAFGFQDATVAPTNLAGWAKMGTNTTAFTAGTLAASTTTTATAVVSATPSAITTIWPAELHLFIEQPSNASTSVFSIRTSTATAADTVTIKRGSYCTLQQ